MQFFNNRSRLCGLVAALVMFAPAGAGADLLGTQLSTPQITFNNDGTTTYDPSTGTFTVQATPLAIRFTPGSLPTIVERPASVRLIIQVDPATGALTSGTIGSDLVVTGTVGGVTSTLLEGEITAFGFADSGGTTDLYDFEFDVTGGTLAGDFPSGLGGVSMNSEQSDFFGSFDVEFSGEAKGTIGQIGAPGACDLELDKTCLVVSTASPDLECTDKIVAMRLRYIGPSIPGASTVELAGSSGASASYAIELTQNTTVLDGQNGFAIDATANGESDLGSKTTIFVNGAAELIHTSCSVPVIAGQPAPLDDPKGDPSPNWLVEAFIDKSGNDVSLPDPQYADNCEIGPFDAIECTERPTAIAYRYTGGDCASSNNTQDPGKFECEDFGSTSGPVQIVITNDSDVYADQGDVAAGDIVEATAANAGRSDFDSEVTIDVIDNAGNLLQHVRMHTSCSQPLRLGDTFGGLEVVGFANADQGTVVNGAEVQYRYEITNNGPDAALNVMVSDTALTPSEVPGSPLASLGAGITEILTATVFVDAPVSGTATATGTTSTGAVCEDTDTSSITIATPPPCEVASAGFELKDDAIKWDITNVGADAATIESIEITWPDQFGDLKEIKLEGDKIFDELVAPPSAVIDSFTGDLHKRQIDAGKTDTLEIKFDEKYKNATPDDFTIVVHFAEGCSITFEPGSVPFGDCSGKISELTMIWGGTVQPVNITAYAGDPGSAVVFSSGDLMIGDEVTVGDFTAAGAPNDVYWEIFDSAGTLLGESKFHRSCSDDEMDGPEDCGMPQGNGKNNDAGFVNDWLLEGLVDEEGALDCSEL